MFFIFFFTENKKSQGLLTLIIVCVVLSERNVKKNAGLLLQGLFSPSKKILKKGKALLKNKTDLANNPCVLFNLKGWLLAFVTSSRRIKGLQGK